MAEEQMYMQNKSFPKKFKLVFIGDQSVGKTSIINRFIYDSFVESDQPTVGIDFIGKTLSIDGQTLKLIYKASRIQQRLQLWDTAGQERFKSLIPSYVRDSDVVLIVYDALMRSSFDNVQTWINYVREARGNDIIVLLIANKIDDETNRQVTPEQGREKGIEIDSAFFEVSAKQGTNIQNLFAAIARKLIGGSLVSLKSEKDEQQTTPEKQPGLQIQQNQNLQQVANKKEQCNC